jgi:hypothetical protein
VEGGDVPSRFLAIRARPEVRGLLIDLQFHRPFGRYRHPLAHHIDARIRRRLAQQLF